MTQPVIRLDRSKPFSSIHGDRTPGDPHYRTHFMQDELPFDAQGVLVPDDGKTEPWTTQHEGDDGVVTTIRHRPLYTPAMRTKLAKKLQKIEARTAKTRQDPAASVEIPGDDGDDDTASSEATTPGDEVNLESWLRGEAEYQAFEISAAYKKRFLKVSHKLRDIVCDLVLDEKLVPEHEVAPALQRMLD